jgi:hypothetical protein
MASPSTAGGTTSASRLHLRLAQRNTDDGSQIVSHDAFAACQVKRTAGVGKHKFRVRFERIFQDGVRNSGVLEKWLTLGVAPRCQAQLSLVILHENKGALAPRELEGHIEKGHQDFIQHPDRVQLAGGFEEQNQFFQIRGFIGDVHHRDLAKEFAGRIGGGVLGIEDHVGDIANSKFQPVVALQRLALDFLAIDKGAVLAALVHHAEFAVFRDDHGMVTGDAGVGDD